MPEDKKNFNDENRFIILSGLFNEEMAKNVSTKLLEYEFKDPLKDIIIFIDSYGGSYDSFINIHDTIKMLRCNVATVCNGKAMSCGQLLLMSGTKGKRFISENSRVLMHPISHITWGTVHQMETDVNENLRAQKLVNQLVVKYTNMKMKEVESYMKQDNYFDAKKSLELGIVDKIIKKSSDLYNNINLR